jgi:hypothetical protein
LDRVTVDKNQPSSKSSAAPRNEFNLLTMTNVRKVFQQS